MLLNGVNALSLIFAVVFLKYRSEINMLQVLPDLTYMRKMLIKMLITMFVFLTMEMSWTDDYIFLYQVYLYQWKEFGLSLASQQVGNAISSNFLEMSQIELTWK